MSRQLETQLRLIAAQAQSLADKASTGSYWCGEMADGGGGYHDLVPIAGRPWQMRGEGECLIRVRPTPLAVAAPPPALPAQLDLFA